VADFLVDEVLDAHEPRLQALMLRSAVLEQMSGPLCDAVLEQEGSGTLLDSLVRTNLFLVPVDHRGEWYRFHRLYAQLLRAELEHREPGLAPTLHERAYAWHRDHGSPDSAIEHALEAGLFAEAGKLIATAWADYASAGRHATVLAWLDRLPCPLRESPRLLLVEAWVLALSGRVEEASRAIAAVEQAGTPDDGSLPDGFGSVEASLATLRGVAVWSDVDRGLEHARRAAELEGPDSPWRATICWALGAGHYLRGELDDADRWLRESVDSALSTDARLDAASSLALRSLVAGEARRVDMQLELAERAWKLAHERGFFAVDGEVHVAKGQSLVARGRLEEALPYFERGVAALKSRGRPLGVAMALLRQATLIRALRERGRATAVLAEARSIVDACPGPGRLLVEQLAALDSPSRTRSCLRNAELSKRELAILRMLNGPLSERDIGRELYLSQNTVHSHTKSIYRKLGVSSRTEALERAVELGLTKH
jgi:LuxR family maltose regulon positive regulatory protein